jgi:hypothetical protein
MQTSCASGITVQLGASYTGLVPQCPSTPPGWRIDTQTPYTYVCICSYIKSFIFVYIHMCVCIYDMYRYIHIYICVWIYMYVYMFIYACVQILNIQIFICLPSWGDEKHHTGSCSCMCSIKYGNSESWYVPTIIFHPYKFL